ncbi:carbonic anhydrase [Paraburkholderia haematera]|uniref:Carbonic anhydrase n=1 Tax=Paraburkholderia haematera TaxID=2793077 RepID=A0ABN7MY82_9BURK|nr:carbonic anhydrase [Paraburkholderia haematera]CAE6835348.1 Carbonic anhydrase 2 [Paraburkholderia haematera]
MTYPQRMLVENLAWSDEISIRDPAYFQRLASNQRPNVLWIGCSDSRVPEAVTRAMPGEIFVHRNIANLVGEHDDSLASVLEYAIVVLRVQHIVVCGHHCCGGVQAALRPPAAALPNVNRRIDPIRRLAALHAAELRLLQGFGERADRLAELNVLAQVQALHAMPLVQSAQPHVQIHGWIFSMHDGRLKALAHPEWALNETADAHEAAG